MAPRLTSKIPRFGAQANGFGTRLALPRNLVHGDGFPSTHIASDAKGFVVAVKCVHHGLVPLLFGWRLLPAGEITIAPCCTMFNMFPKFFPGFFDSPGFYRVLPGFCGAGGIGTGDPFKDGSWESGFRVRVITLKVVYQNIYRIDERDFWYHSPAPANSRFFTRVFRHHFPGFHRV